MYLLFFAIICAMDIQRTYGKAPHCLVPHLKVTVGCEAYVPSFYYDIENDECVYFVYGGCGGGANRFSSKYQCESSCLSQERKEASMLMQEARPAVCYQPILNDKNDCTWFWIKYAFDPTYNNCVTFIGCKDNGNNFDTLTDCEETCLV